MKKTIITFILVFTYMIFPNNTYGASISFSDVKKSNTSYEAIIWAAKEGIVSSTNEKFNPSSSVTEAQFIKMYAEFFAFPTVEGERIHSKVWSDAYYDRLSFYNAPIKGTSNTAIRSEAITRGTVAQLIAFAHGKPHDLTSAIEYMMASGISSGQNLNETNLHKKYGASNTITRSQAVTFLYRLNENKQNKIATSISNNSSTTSVKSSSSFQVDQTKNYFVGGEVNYYIENKDYKNFEIAVMHNNSQIGGYITKNGFTFEGFTIGKEYKDSKKSVTVNNKKLYLLIDSLNGNKLNAIYWESTDSGAQAAFAQAEKDSSTRKFTSLEYLLMEITNVTRTSFNVPTLKYDHPLAAVAKSHTKEMQKNNYFDHYNLKGESPFDRMAKAKLKYSAAGENLAKGFSTFSDRVTIFSIHNALLNSQGHRKNILEKRFEKAGIGIVDGYYTFKFITYQ